jgi:hypothetical protein
VTTIVIDGLNEEDFRRSIENRLREGRPSAAIERLRPLLAPFAGPGGVLPERFLTVEPADLVLTGWERLEEAIAACDQPENPITALTIAFGWPGDEAPEPDDNGNLRPHLETSYFSDNAFPFSQSTREDLLEGYSFYGCSWSGDCEAIDTTLTLEGIDDLCGALALLEARLLASEEPDEDGIRAGSLGACLLSALLVQAVNDHLSRQKLPRPLCVMVGSNGVYPYFDAPVVGMPEPAPRPVEVRAAEPEVVAEADFGVPAPRYSSLLMAGIPRAKKRAVLVLNESDDELATRIARLRNLNHPDEAETETETEASPAPIALAWDDPDTLAERGGPLLAKKPAREGRDSHDVLGLTAPGPADMQTAPCEEVEEFAPAPPPADENHPLGPGFALLQPDLQQRLQMLLAGGALPVAETPKSGKFIEPELIATSWPEAVAGQVEPEAAPPEAIAEPAPEGIWARMRKMAKSWLARLGLS